MVRGVSATLLLVAMLSFPGCQSPTDPDSVVDYDEVVDVTTAPNPIIADTLTGGKTYRVVRGNNQPDDILPYDWHAVFSTTLVFNSKASDKDIDIAFPVRITATTLAVKQASGGIVTPPTGADTEKSEFVILNTSGNQFSAVGSPLATTFEAWYDLPSLRKEAVINVTFAFLDNDDVSFQKVVELNVAP